MRAFILGALFLLAALIVPTLKAQVNYNSRDDKFTLLGLKRAKETYEAMKAEFERQKKFYDGQLISQQEFERVRSQFADAEVNYFQSLLTVLFERQYVTVGQAVKYQNASDRKRVRLQLANASGGNAEFRKLINIDDELFRSLQPDVITNIYVSLSNESGAIISQPYETKVDELRYGEPVFIDFALLQDVDAVTVNITYGNGSQRNPKVFLQKDASVNKVVVQSEQFSQEADLSGSARFDFSLELFSGQNHTFKLDVVNLPPEINRYFVDPVSQAKLSQFKFTESVNTKRASLQVFMPERPTDHVVMDKTIPFYVLVVPQQMKIPDLFEKKWNEEALDALGVGYVRLELIPRGRGRLVVRLPQLFYSVGPNEPIGAVMDIKNDGSRRLDNVKTELDLPLNWRAAIDPQVVPVIGIGEESRVNLKVVPPDGTPPGRYDIRVKTSSLSDNQPVHAEDKTMTVEIVPEANVIGTALLVMLILGLVGAVVYFGIQLTRK